MEEATAFIVAPPIRRATLENDGLKEKFNPVAHDNKKLR